MAITGNQKSLMYALGGIARGGAFRGGYVSGLVFISIGGDHVGNAGDDDAEGVLIRSLSITDSLWERQNQCFFTCKGVAPVHGSPIRITLGSKNTNDPLFAGPVLSTVQLFSMNMPQYPQWQVTGGDYTWQLGFTRVSARYQTTSATAIAQALVAAAAANGFSAAKVQAGLPVLDEFTVTNEAIPDALTRLGKRIGAYWYVDYNKVVHFFLEEVDIAPAPLTTSPPNHADPSYARDSSQLITRCASEGGGANALQEIRPGETIIPVETAAWYNAAGGRVISGPQRLTYTGKQDGGGGALVGPGIGPSAAVTATVVDGAGVEAGAHTYAVTFVTAAGESLSSPLVVVTPGPLADPTAPIVSAFPNPPFGTPSGSYPIPIGIHVVFAYAYSTGVKGVDPLGSKTTLAWLQTPAIQTISNNDPLNPTYSTALIVVVPMSGDPRVKEIALYMFQSNTNVWGLCGRADNPPGAGGYNYQFTVIAQQSPGTPLPTANTTAQNRVQLSSIPIGAAAVTARRIYRSTANTTTPLKRVAQLSDNTTTTYLDAIADAALGVTMPATDTSGLQQPDGQVPAGSIAIIVAGTSAFSSTGGWAIIGNGQQVIRYTAITGGSLTGIPPSGIGAITATVAYNTTITAAPQLLGVAGLVVPILKGDPVNVLVILDSAAGQALLASVIGGDGVIETFIQDRRLSETETRARAQATLDLRSTALIQVRYISRDLRTRAGRTITIGSPMPLPAGTFRIQTVTITNFRPYQTQYPTCTVEASNRRYSFEDLLRRIER